MAISETEFEQLLQPLRSDITAFRVYVSALRLCLLARKAGFRPDQPRVPGGNPDGGQWTDDPGWIGVEGLDIEFPLVLASHHGLHRKYRTGDRQPFVSGIVSLSRWRAISLSQTRRFKRCLRRNGCGSMLVTGLSPIGSHHDRWRSSEGRGQSEARLRQPSYR